MKTLKLVIAATALTLASSAMAAKPTAYEKAQLALLSPALQKQVLARAVDGNTIDGVITTMLLNQISGEFAAGNVVAIDNDDGVIVVSKNGALKTIPFDVTTLVLKQ